MILASNQSDAHGVVVDDTHVYWLTSDDSDIGGRLLEAPLGGGPTRRLIDGQNDPQRLAVDGTRAYWTDRGSGQHDGTVKSVALNDGATTTLLEHQNFPFDIGVTGGFVYFTDADDGTVVRVPAAGGAPVTIAAGQEGIGPLAVRDDGVYWVARGSVFRASLDGRTTTRLFQRVRPFFLRKVRTSLPEALVVEGETIYWTDEEDVIAMPRAGGPASWLVADRRRPWVRGLAVRAGDLYFTYPVMAIRDSPATSQFKIQEDCGFTVMTQAPASAAPRELASIRGAVRSHEADRIAVDATSLYWTDERAGVVGKLTPR